MKLHPLQPVIATHNPAMAKINLSVGDHANECMLMTCYCGMLLYENSWIALCLIDVSDIQQHVAL